MTAPTVPSMRRLGLVLASALVGSIATSFVQSLTTGARLAAIEVRLASVESQLTRITCLQVIGTDSCLPSSSARGKHP